MCAAGLKNRGIVQPEESWKMWTELGSLGLVRKELLKQGRINPHTGNPPTKSTIEKSAFNWALVNQSEARKDLEYAWGKEGEVLTDEKWNKFLVGAARLIYYQRPARFEKFVAQNGLQRYV